MGNRLGKFDIVSNLPVDVVLLTLSYLELTDVESCLLVNHQWNTLISNLSSYWRKTTSTVIRLSKDNTDRLLTSFATPRDHYLAVKRYKAQVTSLKLGSIVANQEQSQATLEDTFYSSCLYTGDGLIVSLRKRRSLGVSLVVECLQNNMLSISQMCSIPLRREDRLAWACASRGIVHWVTRNGVWRAFDMQKGVDLYQTSAPLIRDGIGVTISHCKLCSLVIASHWTPISTDVASTSESHHMSFSVQVMDLGDRTRLLSAMIPWKMFSSKHTHSVFVDHDARFWLRQCLITSGPDACVKNGICTSHRIVLQCDCCTVSQLLDCSTVSASGKIACTLSKPECLTCNFDMDNNTEDMDVRNTSSEIILSSDAQLLGMVFNRRLYVWDVQNTCKDASNFELLASSPLSGERSSTCSAVKLVALGHALSILVYQVGTYAMQYSWLQIVASLTGDTLLELRSWCMCQVDPLHKLHFMTSREDQWLSDIHSMPPSVLAATLDNHHGRVYLNLLQSMVPSCDSTKSSSCSRRNRKWRRLFAKCKRCI